MIFGIKVLQFERRVICLVSIIMLAFNIFFTAVWVLTNDGSCTCKIKCRIVMAKAAGLLLLAHWTWN